MMRLLACACVVAAVVLLATDGRPRDQLLGVVVGWTLAEIAGRD